MLFRHLLRRVHRRGDNSRSGSANARGGRRALHRPIGFFEPLEDRVVLSASVSHDVAIIGNPVVQNGGTFPTSGGVLDSYIFTNLAPGAVNAANLDNYDTVLLNVASHPYYSPGGLGCNVNALTDQAKQALVQWVDAGHKLIIYDSECVPQNYSWLPFTFQTNNPGAQGAHGTLTIVEENTLSSSDSSSPYYIDTNVLGTLSDAVGDANVMTTLDPKWKLDMSATNTNGVTGPVHVYADYTSDTTGLGLMIYNGLDVDYLGPSSHPASAELRQIWIQELGQEFNPSDLPGSVSVVGINLAPATATPTGSTHTVVATLTDQLGQPQSGIEISFQIVSGPNTGAESDVDSTYSPANRESDANGQVSFTYVGDGGVGTDMIETSFVNAQGQTITSQQVTAEWTNTDPELTVDESSVTVDEGDVATNSGTVSDADGDTVALSADLGSVTNNNDGTWSWSLTTTDDLSTTVTIDADDGNGGTASAQFELTVNNVSPTVAPIGVDSDLIPVAGQIQATAQFTDPGTGDTHTAEWDWGDGTVESGTVTETNGSGSVTDNHTYDAAGVYEVQLRVTDDDGGSGTAVFQYVVVYDPDAGFVTGGGRIYSDAGAYLPDPTLEGMANFGFVSKYKKGATVPTGQTEFQFHAGDLNFHSSGYEWLVVTGGDYARFKGTGTINGEGNYRFMVWAGDGEPDTFRMRIWLEDEFGVETDVYDNGMDQAIDGGSIVVHAK